MITTTGTLGQIEPLGMPDGSPIDVGGGDVRHLTPADGLDAVTISNATRALAMRDVLLRDKVNALIAAVNNREQIIPLMIPRTTLGPGEVLAACDLRIPAGFEARVLNAAVASTPATSVLLTVLYNATFGALTGTSLITTYTEDVATTSFQSEGELIVQLTNSSDAPADVSASVIVTMRPVTAQLGGVIGPGVEGPAGPAGRDGLDSTEPGPIGPPGPAGTSVTGPQGVPGETGPAVYTARGNVVLSNGTAWDAAAGLSSSYIWLQRVGPPSGVLCSGGYDYTVSGTSFLIAARNADGTIQRNDTSSVNWMWTP